MCDMCKKFGINPPGPGEIKFHFLHREGMIGIACVAHPDFKEQPDNAVLLEHFLEFMKTAQLTEAERNAANTFINELVGSETRH